MGISAPLARNCADYFVWFCRIWGIATALVLWGIGIEVAFQKEVIGYYVIGVALIMSCLETVFLIHYLVKESHRDLSKSCLSCWSYVLLFDDWIKAILYTLLSIFCLIRNYLLEGEAWLSIIAGAMVLLSALFYFIKSCTASQLRLPTSSDHNSVSNTYNRIDRTGEELGSGGSIANDMPANYYDTVSIQSGAALLSNTLDISLADQDGIMEA